MVFAIERTPTTELDAINGMLIAVGERPTTQAQIDTPTHPDIKIAIEVFQETIKDVLGMQPWRFNSEFGYEVTPSSASPFAWVDTEGVTTQLNVFEADVAPFTNMISFGVSAVDRQAELDLVLRESRKYENPGGTKHLVFYDRAKNRDGIPEDDFPFLYVDPVWFVKWIEMPQVARRYIYVKAARAFSASVVGSANLIRLTAQDEAIALRNLKREQGEQDDYNMFRDAARFRFLGRRPVLLGGVADTRKSRGPV